MPYHHTCCAGLLPHSQCSCTCVCKRRATSTSWPALVDMLLTLAFGPVAKEELENWDSESSVYFMQQFQKLIDEDVIPLEGHHHTICFAETLLEDVHERFGREALSAVLAFRKADWDEALAFMKPECKCDDPEHDHPPCDSPVATAAWIHLDASDQSHSSHAHVHATKKENCVVIAV